MATELDGATKTSDTEAAKRSRRKITEGKRVLYTRVDVYESIYDIRAGWKSHAAHPHGERPL